MRSVRWVRIVASAAVCAGVLSLGSSLAAQPNAPKPPGADLFVAASGSDAGRCTKSAPCATFNRAYRVAAPGEIVEVAGGAYPEQQIDPDSGKRSDKDVVFRPAARVKVTLGGPLKLYASHVTVERMAVSDLMIVSEAATGVAQSDVTAKHIDANTLQINSARQINVIGGDYGPSIDNNSGIRKSGPTMPGGILIDGANFHDYRCAGGLACHIECLIVGAVDGLTVRNSRFSRCAIYDVFLQGFNGNISNVTFERNWFEPPTGPDGQGVWPHALRFSAGYGYDKLVVRANSFLQAFAVGGTAANSQVSRNIGTLDPYDSPGGCGDPAIKYEQNIWQNAACSPSDRRPPFGYTVEPGTLKPVKEQADVVTRIFSQAQRGRPLAAIATELRRAGAPAPERASWNVALVRKILTDPDYRGGLYGAKGAHPALVSAKAWRSVQKRLSSR